MSLILHTVAQAGNPEYIHIQDDSSGVIYSDTPTNFSLDYGSDFPVLPVNAIRREYIPSQYHQITDDMLMVSSDVAVWAEGDTILSSVAALIVAQNLRNAPPLPPANTLQEDKDEAAQQVDITAELARLRYITPGAGQAMAYIEKGDEAADYVAAAYPADLTTFPFIQAEVNATGKTSTQAADDILTQKSNWITVGAAVEQQRLLGKTNIDSAVDGAAVTSARDAAITALEAI